MRSTIPHSYPAEQLTDDSLDEVDYLCVPCIAQGCRRPVNGNGDADYRKLIEETLLGEVVGAKVFELLMAK
jgi:hypothetical protein